jgi:hypothetical protein
MLSPNGTPTKAFINKIKMSQKCDREQQEERHTIMVGYNFTNSEGEAANLDDARPRSDAGDVRGRDRSDYIAAPPSTL